MWYSWSKPLCKINWITSTINSVHIHYMNGTDIILWCVFLNWLYILCVFETPLFLSAITVYICSCFLYKHLKFRDSSVLLSFPLIVLFNRFLKFGSSYYTMRMGFKPNECKAQWVRTQSKWLSRLYVVHGLLTFMTTSKLWRDNLCNIVYSLMS